MSLDWTPIDVTITDNGYVCVSANGDVTVSDNGDVTVSDNEMVNTTDWGTFNVTKATSINMSGVRILASFYTEIIGYRLVVVTHRSLSPNRIDNVTQGRT